MVPGFIKLAVPALEEAPITTDVIPVIINSPGNSDGNTPNSVQPLPGTAITRRSVVPAFSRTNGKANVVAMSECPEHIVIGDSLTRGINIANCLTITRGGGEILDILKMLHDNTDELPKSESHRIKSITLCVGTNDL